MMFVLYMSIGIYNIFCGMAIVVDFVVDSFTIRPPSVSLIWLFWAVRFPRRVIWNRQRGAFWRNVTTTCAGNAAERNVDNCIWAYVSRFLKKMVLI